MPFAKGIYSVGYTTQADAISPAVTSCDQAIPIRDIDENLYTFVPAQGANYVYSPLTSSWASVSPFVFTGLLVTRAYVAGRTFICYERARIIEYNTGTGLFDTIVLTLPVGLSMADIRGIGGASNYLLLFTDFAIYWCSPLDILDFDDIDAGAGNQTPVDIKGQITALMPIAGGFIVYTARNAIGATFTNNAAAPFSFKEVQNAGGLASWEYVTPDADDTGHYIWSTHGLQFATLVKAVSIFPEVTDFLVGKVLEEWNTTTKEIEVVTTLNPFNVHLTFQCGRYLIISYGGGTTIYEGCLVYDTVLQRWGKLKIEHMDVFTYPYQSGVGGYTYDTLPGTYDELVGDYASLALFFLAIVPAKTGIAFLLNTGEIKVVDLSFDQENTGVAIFGHIAQRNDRQTTLIDVQIDGLKSTPTPEVSILPSENGKDRSVVSLETAQTADATYQRYQPRITAKNIDIAIEGCMVLSNVEIMVMLHGYR
jgi:hypothetical protein